MQALRFLELEQKPLGFFGHARAVGAVAQIVNDSALMFKNTLAFGRVTFGQCEVLDEDCAVHDPYQHETDRRAVAVLPLRVAFEPQPFGSTIGRSRSSRTQSPFSISASRPSSRSRAIRAWRLS